MKRKAASDAARADTFFLKYMARKALKVVVIGCVARKGVTSASLGSVANARLSEQAS
jgi:hypothetical protein